MGLLERLKLRKKVEPIALHLRQGQQGETAAKKLLQKKGLKYLTANFSGGRGEIDLVFREEDCLVFVEVKTRAAGQWMRPAAAVDARKKLALTRTAFDYLRLLDDPQVKIRFDIVEVLLKDGELSEVRHLPNAFNLTPPFRHG
jgi:putative endonuclease